MNSSTKHRITMTLVSIYFFDYVMVEVRWMILRNIQNG